MYSIRNSIRLITIPKGTKQYDTGMKAFSAIFDLDIQPAIPDYFVTLSQKGTILLSFSKPVPHTISATIRRNTPNLELVASTHNDGAHIAKHYVQVMQDKAAELGNEDPSEVLEESDFSTQRASAMRSFRYDHHPSVQTNSRFKQPKYDITGSPEDVEVVDYGTILEDYSFFSVGSQTLVHDRDAGLSKSNGRPWRTIRERLTPIRSIDIDGGVITVELFKYMYNPLKERQEVIKEFTNNVNRGIIYYGRSSSAISDIEESYGLLTFKAAIDPSNNYIANMALELNGQPIALEVEYARKRSI